MFSRIQRWPAAIVTVLLLQMAFGIWMAHVARDDPHFAVEPNYYARAVNWDSTMAQARRDRALGWTAATTLTRRSDRSATLRLTLTDATGRNVTADSVRVEALQVAHAGQIDRLTLTPGNGGYSAIVPIAANGLWDVEVRAVRGTDVFTAKLRTELR